MIDDTYNYRCERNRLVANMKMLSQSLVEDPSPLTLVSKRPSAVEPVSMSNAGGEIKRLLAASVFGCDPRPEPIS